MESDSVRTTGDSTLVDLWIEGKFRAITISRQAIEAYLHIPAGSDALGETERREFVRTHLSLVVAAASARLRADPDAESIIIEVGQLSGQEPSAAGERRNTDDRRKTDRRKKNVGPPGGIERRGR
jgi:hypothetical protein